MNSPKGRLDLLKKSHSGRACSDHSREVRGGFMGIAIAAYFIKALGYAVCDMCLKAMGGFLYF